MEEFLSHLSLLEAQIEENVNDDLIGNVDVQEFSERMDICSKAVSEESTKFCLAYNTDVEINLIQPIITRLKSAINSFVSAFISTPKYFGKYSKSYFKEMTLSILKNLKELVYSLKRNDGSHKQLLGNLWSQVDNFITFKKTNQNIILLNVNESNKLLADALLELHNEIQEYSNTKDDIPNDDIDEFEINWNANDITIVNSVFGILKTLQATCVKLEKVIASHCEVDKSLILNPLCIQNSEIAEKNIDNNFRTINSTDYYVVCFDDICGYILSFSPLVDEVISNLYAPIEKDALHQQVNKLIELLNDLLNKSRLYNFMNQEDINRIDFLKTALDHNFNKFTTSLCVN